MTPKSRGLAKSGCNDVLHREWSMVRVDENFMRAADCDYNLADSDFIYWPLHRVPESLRNDR